MNRPRETGGLVLGIAYENIWEPSVSVQDQTTRRITYCMLTVMSRWLFSMALVGLIVIGTAAAPALPPFFIVPQSAEVDMNRTVDEAYGEAKLPLAGDDSDIKRGHHWSFRLRYAGIDAAAETGSRGGHGVVPVPQADCQRPSRLDGSGQRRAVDSVERAGREDDGLADERAEAMRGHRRPVQLAVRPRVPIGVHEGGLGNRVRITGAESGRRGPGWSPTASPRRGSHRRDTGAGSRSRPTTPTKAARRIAASR